MDMAIATWFLYLSTFKVLLKFRGILLLDCVVNMQIPLPRRIVSQNSIFIALPYKAWQYNYTSIVVCQSIAILLFDCVSRLKVLFKA